MKYFAPSEKTNSSPADIDRLVSGAGGHEWTQNAVEAYMRTEAKKLRANGLYYFAKCIPCTGEDKLDLRLELATQAGLIISGFVAAACMLIACALGVCGIEAGSAFALAAAVSGSLCLACFHFATSTVGYWIKGPGYWKTESYDPLNHLHYAPQEARERIERLQVMIPHARFEISLLMQDEALFDPVLWLVLEMGDITLRRPFLVWDEYGKIVLPC